MPANKQVSGKESLEREHRNLRTYAAEQRVAGRCRLGLIGAELVDEHCPVLSAVTDQVRRAVAVDIQPPDSPAA